MSPIQSTDKGKLPKLYKNRYKGFLKEHTSNVNKSFFVKVTGKLWPAADAAALSEDSLMVLVPAFMVIELTASELDANFYISIR